MNTITTVTEVHVVRDGPFYFYSRVEAGESIVFAQRIPVERARQIIETAAANGAETSARGPVTFQADCDVQFSFLAKWIDRS